MKEKKQLYVSSFVLIDFRYILSNYQRALLFFQFVLRKTNKKRGENYFGADCPVQTGIEKLFLSLEVQILCSLFSGNFYGLFCFSLTKNRLKENSLSFSVMKKQYLV